MHTICIDQLMIPEQFNTNQSATMHKYQTVKHDRTSIISDDMYERMSLICLV